MIGEGLAFDTSRYCVICSNVLGSCYGTTGPSSVNEDTGLPFGPDFPLVTVRDMVRAQGALLDALGVRRLAAVAGGSMGGMQALRGRLSSRIASSGGRHRRHRPPLAAADRPERGSETGGDVGSRVARGPLLPGARATPRPGRGPHARPRHVSLRRGHGAQVRTAPAGRRSGVRRLDPQFEVEHYLRHQGERFVERFDANSLLYLTKAIDEFDLAGGYPSLEEALAPTRARFLLVTFSSDWLYPPHELARVADALHQAGKPVTYRCLESDCGHDAFLLEHEAQAQPLRRAIACRPDGTPALLLPGRRDADDGDANDQHRRGSRVRTVAATSAHRGPQQPADLLRSRRVVSV